MKRIILIFFMIIVGIITFADYDGFSEEFCKTGLENNGRYDFDVSNFQIDLDGDKKIEDVEIITKNKFVLKINGKKMEISNSKEIGKTIYNIRLYKHNKEIYIGLVYKKNEYTAIAGYKYKNEKLISLKEKKVVKTVLIQTEMNKLDKMVIKTKDVDGYKLRGIETEDCDSETYELGYDKNGKIIRVIYRECSQTGESGSFETQYFIEGKLRYFIDGDWTMFDGDMKKYGEIQDEKVVYYQYFGNDDFDVLENRKGYYDSNGKIIPMMQGGKLKIKEQNEE